MIFKTIGYRKTSCMTNAHKFVKVWVLARKMVHIDPFGAMQVKTSERKLGILSTI